MSTHATDYFNQVQSMLLSLHSSLLSNQIAKDEIELARQSNAGTLAMMDGAKLDDQDGTRLDRIRTKLQANERALETYDVLINVAAGGMLQIAKQIISMKNGPKKGDSPQGRSIAGTCLRDLIWHGRNQAMHYEHTNIAPPTGDPSTWVKMFQKLNAQYPHRFLMSPPYKSCAIDVLDVLGWTYSYSTLEQDMRSLIGATTP
ncbi:hypothetical protein HMH05_12560 [Pseudomonas sp. SbB1]|uniref:Uncharacterized protein n=1 Tax=Pseudomonas putida (strain GB-1) TaxID=76869 RepID=B0KMC3_PSEPG|nr:MULTISPECIES: hypothetical protein [Pseudomonas]ABY96599.1 hypothetical protein PputGB1_0689 [Pseudomonas putida GB-1]MBP0706345.1 hypothetical protein [Pseudomonas sp. T34]MCK2185782.1 hypothetical protein [Pseudomonas sp. MB04B]MDD2085040.1 hypothetical protein [Pseudomonas putida]MDD2095013.1 hypothetical protein [Pseudomonas putida]